MSPAAAHEPAANPPKVSIIMPTYNGMPYLREAVESIRAQTFGAWELIVIDDGSTDDSLSWVESLADERIRVLRSEHIGHRAQLRNRGIAAARGEWIAFNDSDDRWKPQKLERQMAYHAAHPELRWSYTGRAIIDKDGNAYSHPLHKPWVPHRGWILRPLLTFAAQVALPAVIVHRSLLEETGGFWDHAWGEDVELWPRLAQRAECGLIDEPLVEIRAHPSTSAGRPEVPRAHTEIFRRLAASAQDPIDRRLARSEHARQALRYGRALLLRNEFRPAFAALLTALRIQPLNPLAWRALARGALTYAAHRLRGR